jgi:hypothetical protein
MSVPTDNFPHLSFTKLHIFWCVKLGNDARNNSVYALMDSGIHLYYMAHATSTQNLTCCSEPSENAKTQKVNSQTQCVKLITLNFMCVWK